MRVIILTTLMVSLSRDGPLARVLTHHRRPPAHLGAASVDRVAPK
jgi:hypothetical protein